MLEVLVIDADSDFASLVGRSLLKAGHEIGAAVSRKLGLPLIRTLAIR
jgi:ActR/RegA family two-component response regulator